ncbi:MAG: DUF58 domain-containing protein [Candidatus Eremiobacteraeota bacterium]|nr:DUF58 domain-containing protein [Candidatus Eremiobacteraeota bacterium]
MMRPTRRAVLVFAALLPLPWLLVVVAPALWTFAFDASALMLVVFATDAALAYPRRRLQLDLRTPEAAFVGVAMHATLALDAAGGRRPNAFEVMLDLGGEADPSLAHNPFAVGASAPADVEIVPRRRGLARIDAAWVRWRGPLGFVQQTRRFALDRVTRVFPSVHASRPAAFDLLFRDALLGSKVQPHSGEGSEFESLREHASGMDVRFVDWKHSARHRKLLSKEFRAERNHPVVLAFDTGHLMREPLDGLARLDHAINAGLLLAWLALRSGDLVGAYGFDARPGAFVTPARGTHRFRHLQQVSADLTYGTDETNFTLGLAALSARLDRRSLIVLFTDFVDTVTAELLVENVQRLTRRHLVVFVALTDPLPSRILGAPPDAVRQMARAVVAYDVLRDRSIVFERLTRMGIHCLDVPSARLSASLLNTYIRIKQRGLL